MINQEFKSLKKLEEVFPDDETCIKHLEQLRWNGHVVSPFDKYSKVYACANNKYRCKNTSKYFNVKTGSLFDGTKISLKKWFVSIWLVNYSNEEISSTMLAKKIGVTQKSAWNILQRIKQCYGIKDKKD